MTINDEIMQKLFEDVDDEPLWIDEKGDTLELKECLIKAMNAARKYQIRVDSRKFADMLGKKWEKYETDTDMETEIIADFIEPIIKELKGMKL
jgi:hypothetical protein